MSIVAGHDATHDNIGHLPPGQAAGYTTGTSGIRWTSADWKAHPGAVRIDQDFAASDPSADVLDVERGAATYADCPVWAKKAKADFANAVRPGQRRPAIYFSASAVHDVVNALVNGGVKDGVGLFIASWGIGEQAAMADIANASGPFPIVAVQYMNGPFFDYDVFDSAWLDDVSGNINPVHNLHVTKTGYTGINIAWDAAPGATGYTAHAQAKGRMLHTVNTAKTSCRLGFLHPRREYEITVRAHPGHSAGLNASLKATTK